MQKGLWIVGVFFLGVLIVGCNGNAVVVCKECGKDVTTSKAELCKDCLSSMKSGEPESTGEKVSTKHYDGWGRNFEEGLARAKKENKSLLVLFTGSDWCPPCKSLHENVLASSAFQNEIPNAVVLVVCDNPRDDSLVTPEERKQYQELSASGNFQVSGVPSLFLTDSDGNPYHKIVGYGGTPAGEWISDLKSKIKSGGAP